MGRHSASHGGAGNTDSGRRHPARTADAEDRALVEPDRDAAGKVPPAERAAREKIHTDRDPVDDIHLAAERPQSGTGA